MNRCGDHSDTAEVSVESDATPTSSKPAARKWDVVFYHSPSRRETCGLSSVTLGVQGGWCSDRSTENRSQGLSHQRAFRLLVEPRHDTTSSSNCTSRLLPRNRYCKLIACCFRLTNDVWMFNMPCLGPAQPTCHLHIITIGRGHAFPYDHLRLSGSPTKDARLLTLSNSYVLEPGLSTIIHGWCSRQVLHESNRPQVGHRMQTCPNQHLISGSTAG
jgi:hypothetical protein